MEATKKVSVPPPAGISRTTSGGGSGSILQNKYQLGRLLGRGNFAKVYQGRCLEDSSEVAIKVIDKAANVKAPLEQLIVQEISAMRRLGHHPNILKLHEVLASKPRIYLVMELAPGGELFSKLKKRGRFSEATSREYFYQLISALHFCHQHGIAHRDIKPQNLLLDEKGALKVSDFGLSALPEQLKDGLLHTACGTPAFSAPEVMHGKGYDGAKADAWSCGVILYVFLMGSLPYDDSNLPELYRAMHRRVSLPDSIPQPARGIIYRLLDPNPATRLSIEELMKFAWFKKPARAQEAAVQGEVGGDVNLEKDCKYMVNLNAFDIISLSCGLDLSRLFHVGLGRKEMRFTSRAQVGEIEERMVKIGRELGYRVERGKGGGLKFAKRYVVLDAEILVVAQELLMVELKVVDGRVVEFEESKWEVLKAGFADIALSWHNDCGGA